MLDKGVVIVGDIKVKLVDIELLTIQIRLMIASVDKAKEVLGFEATTTLEEMLDEVIPWVRNALSEGVI